MAVATALVSIDCLWAPIQNAKIKETPKETIST